MYLTVTSITRPSRSKCPNAWAARAEDLGSSERPTWLTDGDTIVVGTEIVVGGNLRRATRTEKLRETITIDGPGTYPAWGGFGAIQVERT